MDLTALAVPDCPNVAESWARPAPWKSRNRYSGSSSTVTARVYRHQIRPVIAQGAATMDAIFSPHKEAQSA